MTRQVKTIVRNELKKNTELKYVQQHVNEYPITPLGAVTPILLTEIQEGTAPGQRIGKEVTCTGMHIKGVVANIGNVTNFVRFAVIQLKGASSIDSASDILFAKSGTIGAAGTITVSTGGGYQSGVPLTGLESIYYKLSDAKCTVLKEWTVKLGRTTTLDGSDSVMFNHFIKRKQKIQFLSTIGSSGSNPIFLCVWAAEGPDDTSVGNLIECSTLMTTYYVDS